MSAIMRSRNGVMLVSFRDRSRGRTALPSTKGYQEVSGSATAPLSCGGAAPFNRHRGRSLSSTPFMHQSRAELDFAHSITGRVLWFQWLVWLSEAHTDISVHL